MNKLKNILKRILPEDFRIKLHSFFDFVLKKIKIIIGKIKGINYVDPNCLYKNTFDQTTLIVDVGCGSDADFSVYMMAKYGIKSVAIDPTERHAPSLKKLADASGGRFRHLPMAVSALDGEITFNESPTEMSGSIFESHRNIRNHDTRQYTVKSISLKSIPQLLGLEKVPYIKLDLEGAEYSLIDSLNEEDVEKYDQIFVEFHHYCIPEYSHLDTRDRVNKLTVLGFKSFSPDGINILFYR